MLPRRGREPRRSPVNFYLANFLKKEDGTYNSIIVNTWQTVDLSPLVGARSPGLQPVLLAEQRSGYADPRLLRGGQPQDDGGGRAGADEPGPLRVRTRYHGGLASVLRGPAARPARHDELSEVTR